MIANYHTHTWRCNHAVGTEREYVEKAIEAGLEILGFSDHTPYIFPGEYYSTFRMRLGQLQGYVDTVLQLKQEYAGQIQIHLGLELEYYPGLLGQLLPVLKDQPLEYLLLGQHLLGDEIAPWGREHYNGNATDDPKLLERYVNQAIEGMGSGLFTYLAHPDLFFFTGEEKIYRQHMRRLCREAAGYQIPLEINLLGYINGRHYPNDIFWQEAAEENCRVILGRDAHAPDQFARTDTLEMGMELVRKYQLRLIEIVDLRPIRA